MVIASAVDAETGDDYEMYFSDSITCTAATISDCGESNYSSMIFTIQGPGNLPFAIVSLITLCGSVSWLGFYLMNIEE